MIIPIEGRKGRGEHVPGRQKKRGADAWRMVNPMLECGTCCWKGMKGNARGLISYSFERLKIYNLYFFFPFVRKWNYWWIANISKNLCFLGSRVCGGYIYIYIIYFNMALKGKLARSHISHLTTFGSHLTSLILL